jgi:glycosyltransferase involved in cell wall biosynthesis
MSLEQRRDQTAEEQTPKVTIVIPAYNAMGYLPETMETILNQTYTDFEALVIDDGSTDNVVEWVSQLKDSRVKIVSQANQGVSTARNQGIELARGEYVAFSDADDLWEPTKLAKQVNRLDQDSVVGLVYVWTALADQNGIPTGRVISSDAEGNVWRQLTALNMVCCGSTPLVRRCCFETVGLFALDIGFSEDWDMWLRIAAEYPFAVVKEPLLRYRQHQKNASRNCQLMLEGSRIIIERTFKSASTELLHLRNRSYGCIYLYLAWRAIEDMDYQQSTYFRSLAIAHHPQLLFSSRYIRLIIASILLRWFGADFYSKVLGSIYSLRRFGLVAANR